MFSSILYLWIEYLPLERHDRIFRSFRSVRLLDEMVFAYPRRIIWLRQDNYIERNLSAFWSLKWDEPHNSNATIEFATQTWNLSISTSHWQSTSFLPTVLPSTILPTNVFPIRKTSSREKWHFNNSFVVSNLLCHLV